jgi:lysophosphatidylglycerol acyltransferase 1
MRQDKGELHPSGLYWSLWWLVSFRWLLNVARLLWVTANNLYVIPAYFVWMFLFTPLAWLDSGLFWHVEDVLFGWLLSMVACWNYSAGYNVVESGDRLDRVTDENVIFMPNHQSTADVPLCMTLFVARPNFADRVMWIMDRVFKYSNFGCVSWMHDDFFILAGRENRDSSLVDLRKHLHRVFVRKQRKYIVLFPEGGFLRKRKPVSQRFAKKNDLPSLEFCTLPRTGALEVILECLGPNATVNANGAGGQNGSVKNTAKTANLLQANPDALTKIVDVTIAYPDGNPLDLLSIATGWRPPCTTHVHYRVFDIKDLPIDSDGIKHWMYNLYAEKDKMLEYYYENGTFPYNLHPPASTSTAKTMSLSEREPRHLYHDPMRFALLHVFFVVSTLLFLWAGYSLYYNFYVLLW